MGWLAFATKSKTATEGAVCLNRDNLASRKTKRANYMVEDERGAGKQTIDSLCWHTYDTR